MIRPFWNYFSRLSRLMKGKLIQRLLPDFMPQITAEIINHYGADYLWNDQKSQNVQKDTANLGYGLIHYSLIRNQKPKKILCVGSMYGFIPFMCARACQDNGIGHVDFVDASFDMKNPDDKVRHIYGQGFWRQVEPEEHFSTLLKPKYINTYVMTIENFLKKYPNRQYDYIYLDGDHRYTGSKRAVKLTFKRLNEEGYLCLHDIHFRVKAEGIEFGQWQVWQELCRTSDFKLEFSNHYSGIGLIQKITKNRPMFTHDFDADPQYQIWRQKL